MLCEVSPPLAPFACIKSFHVRFTVREESFLSDCRTEEYNIMQAKKPTKNL